MKWYIKYLVLVVVLILPVSVFADEVDMDKKGSIKIHYSYSDTTISGGMARLYKVAVSQQDGKFSYVDDYHLSDSLDVETASEWNDLAVKINDYITTNHVKELYSCEIKDNDDCLFQNLDVGLYLVTVASVVKGEYEYSSSPTLIALPTYNETNQNYMYDIDSFMKVKAKAIHVDNNTPLVPKTIDEHDTYFITFVVSIVVILLVVLYIYILRKKDEKNGKNK